MGVFANIGSGGQFPGGRFREGSGDGLDFFVFFFGLGLAPKSGWLGFS